MSTPTGPHPANHLGCQVFHFGHLRWCVTLADELIAADPDQATFVPEGGIDRLGTFLPGGTTPGTVPLFQVHVDTVYAMTTDLSRPLTVVRLPARDGEDMGAMVIDGWHRIYRALAEGRTTLPVRLLSPEVERAARLPMPGFLRGTR